MTTQANITRNRWGAVRPYSIKRLKVLRKSALVSIKQASRALEISQSAFTAYEAGHALASDHLRIRWSHLVAEPIRRRFRRLYGERSYGQLLRYSARMLSLTQGEISSRMGVSHTAVSCWVRSHNIPISKHREELASILGPLAIYDGSIYIFNAPEMRRIRKREGMTQKELAEKIGKNKGTISQWESSVAEPSLKNIDLLAKALCTLKEKLSTKCQPSEDFQNALAASGLSDVDAAKLLGVNAEKVNLWSSGDVWPPEWSVKRLQEVEIPGKIYGPPLKLHHPQGLIELYVVGESHIRTVDGMELATIGEGEPSHAVKALIKEGVLARWSQRVVDGESRAASKAAVEEFREVSERLRLQRSGPHRWRFVMDSKVVEVNCSKVKAAAYVLEALQWGRLPTSPKLSEATEWKDIRFWWA